MPWTTPRSGQPRQTSNAASQIQPPTTDKATLSAELYRPITHVVIPSIDLGAELVQSSVVPVDGGYTEQVPAFKVGHAEMTAGAGQAGNAVLLGHVTGLRSGNVFQNLDRVNVGDTVLLFSDTAEFDYLVVSSTVACRSDSSVLQPIHAPSASLITCTGVWLPTIWDYTECLVVHAELSQEPRDSRSPCALAG